MIRKILKEKMFYLFQNYALVDDMTVDQNFKIILKINPEFEDEKKFRESGIEWCLSK